MNVIDRSSLKPFNQYVKGLEEVIKQAVTYGLDSTEPEKIAAILNGQPSSALRDMVPLDVRRSAGAFFTGAELAARALAPYVVAESQSAIYIDPTCGAGDLLVACARRLSLECDLKSTLIQWGQQLRGFDIFPEFVRATRARLALLAIERGAKPTTTPLPPLEQLFPHIKIADGLSGLAATIKNTIPTHVVLNPPYLKTPAPENCAWASGKVSSAAVFLDDSLAQAQPGTRITAILPDVLRSGSLYMAWRTGVEKRAAVKDIEVVGLFDQFADVDVFILRLVVGEKNKGPVTWWKPDQSTTSQSVEDLFEVRVGPVVPHRDPNCGQWHAYIHTRLVPAWEQFDADKASRRRYWGRVFMPPFVVVRRTSAPGDPHRAVASIIVGSAPVAVENHLIVLKPLNNSLSLCRQLVRVLRTEATDKWLDERIRCRHLTVSALRDLPWRSL